MQQNIGASSEAAVIMDQASAGALLSSLLVATRDTCDFLSSLHLVLEFAPEKRTKHSAGKQNIFVILAF